jgi:hypothetical protein
MLDDVAAYYFVELVIGEWVGKVVEVVNHVGGGSWIDIHPDRAGSLVRPAPDVEHAPGLGGRRG